MTEDLLRDTKLHLEMLSYVLQKSAFLLLLRLLEAIESFHSQFCRVRECTERVARASPLRLLKKLAKLVRFVEVREVPQARPSPVCRGGRLGSVGRKQLLPGALA